MPALNNRRYRNCVPFFPLALQPPVILHYLDEDSSRQVQVLQTHSNWIIQQGSELANCRLLATSGAGSHTPQSWAVERRTCSMELYWFIIIMSFHAWTAAALMPLPLHHKKKRKQSRKSPRLRQHAKISTNCSKFRIVQHELSVESVDGNKMLGSYVTTCTGFLFTLGRILNWHFCVLNHMSCDNQIIWQ